MKTTACLLSYRRPYHIPVIAESLRAVAEIDEIVCWCNVDEPTPEIEACCDRVFHSETNRYVYGRYLAAREARNQICVTIDDDVIADNFSELISRHYLSGNIVANLADDRSSRHWTVWQRRDRPWVEMGFGSAFCRDMVHVLEEWPYDANIRDRKADKILSIMYPWEAVRKTNLTRLYHEGRESGRDENALWLRRDHKRLTVEAVRLAQEWKATCQEKDS